MTVGIAVALALIVGTGVLFIVLRGDSSPRPSARKRQNKGHRQRREQARETDARNRDAGEAPRDDGPAGDDRPGRDAASR